MKYLLVTPGEPAGIGPDLSLILAHKEKKQALVFICDPNLLTDRASELGLSIEINCIEPLQQLDITSHYTGCDKLLCIPISLKSPVVAGELNYHNSPYVLETLDMAISLLDVSQQTSTCYKGLVTGPIHKGIINEYQCLQETKQALFTGHTEYLAKNSHTKDVIMMLATKGLKVALVTTHLPLRSISDYINQSLVTKIIQLLDQELKAKFSISAPKIFVCGLNPHAGEDGHLGTEEIDEIIPAIKSTQSLGINAIGPLPADTVFTKPYLDQADVILAMYHDQGLPVLKHKGFGHAVNVTLGLPFIRTSVDHGTALDLAGKLDLIHSGSIDYAIETAMSMTS